MDPEPLILAVRRPAAEVEQVLHARRWPALVTPYGEWTQVVLANGPYGAEPVADAAGAHVPLTVILAALDADAYAWADDDLWARDPFGVQPLDDDTDLPPGADAALTFDPFTPGARGVVALDGDRREGLRIAATGLGRPLAAVVLDAWTLVAPFGDDHTPGVLGVRAVLHEMARRRRSVALLLDGEHLRVVLVRGRVVEDRQWGPQPRRVALDQASGQARELLDAVAAPDPGDPTGLWPDAAPDLAALWAGDLGTGGAAERAGAIARALHLPPAALDVLIGDLDLAAHPDAVVAEPATSMPRAVARTALGRERGPLAWWTWLCALLTPLVVGLAAVRWWQLLDGHGLDAGPLTFLRWAQLVGATISTPVCVGAIGRVVRRVRREQ